MDSASQASHHVEVASRRVVVGAALSVIAAGLSTVAFIEVLQQRRRPPRIPEYAAEPVHHPFLIMNPASGDGKVEEFSLDRKARELGAEVFLLEEGADIDVAEIARQAVSNGADLLGVAGGDGTQALVAGVAAEHDLPFVVLAAGTRNHLALDLGLDRKDPSEGLGALTDADAVEVRIDLGYVNDRVFVNNCSFGAYATVIEDPEYRDAKVATALRVLPDLLAGKIYPPFAATVGAERFEQPQALLVSNNPYGTEDAAGLGSRARLDTGHLGVIVIKVDGAAQAATLLAGASSDGMTALLAEEVEVTSDPAQIPVGIDGEHVELQSPVKLTIRPRALRVRVPRDRPGVPVANPLTKWIRFRNLSARRPAR